MKVRDLYGEETVPDNIRGGLFDETCRAIFHFKKISHEMFFLFPAMVALSNKPVNLIPPAHMLAALAQYKQDELA